MSDTRYEGEGGEQEAGAGTKIERNKIEVEVDCGSMLHLRK
jgi:hypothetical protein